MTGPRPRLRRTGGDRRVVVRPVAQFAVVGLAAVLVVALATAAASRRIGEREAITDARSTAIIRAQRVVEPVLTDALLEGDPAAIDAVRTVVEERVLDEDLVRVKLWDPDGRILYADAEGLIGSRYDLGEDEQEAIEAGVVEAEVSDLGKPENRFERRFGKLLEVYLPVRTDSGQRILFEAYFRYDAVAAAGGTIWRSFAPVTIGALVVLELVQIPLAWSLAAQLRHRQRERERLLQRAVDASEAERRRIAADLHDGVVQDLVGASFELAGAAREPGHSPAATRALADAAEVVRNSITALRSMLLDIYPPDLHQVGLHAALEDLAVAATAEDRRVVVVPGDDLAHDAVGAAARQVLYRAAREAIRNVVAHADAREVVVRVGRSGSRADVEVADDGRGFTPDEADAARGEGHLGLAGLRGVVEDAEGTLEVRSVPGDGTTVRVEVPLR